MMVFGLAVGIFAIQNTIQTTVTIIGYHYNLPLYFVIIGSMLVGILAASIIGMVNGLASTLALSRKDRQISATTHDYEKLQQKVLELEQENAFLRQDKHDIVVEKDAEIHEANTEAAANKPSFFENIRHSFR